MEHVTLMFEVAVRLLLAMCIGGGYLFNQKVLVGVLGISGAPTSPSPS